MGSLSRPPPEAIDPPLVEAVEDLPRVVAMVDPRRDHGRRPIAPPMQVRISRGGAAGCLRLREGGVPQGVYCARRGVDSRGVDSRGASRSGAALRST